MTPSVGPDAERELTDGAVYYAREAKNADLGLAFIVEFERALEKQAPLPSAPISLQHHLRRHWRRTAGYCACPSSAQARLLDRSQVNSVSAGSKKEDSLPTGHPVERLHGLGANVPH